MKLYIGFMVIVLIAGLGFMIHFGLQPKPISKISISSFENPNVVASATLLRLNEELKAHSLVVLGVGTDAIQLEVIAELLKLQKTSSVAFDSLLIDQTFSNYSDKFAQPEIVNLMSDLAKLAPQLGDAIAKGRRILILAPLVHASQKVAKGFAARLKTDFGLMPMSISFSKLARSRADEQFLEVACATNVADNTGVGSLGCDILQAGRLHYRKKLKSKNLVGLLEQIGLSDYLFLLAKEL